MDQTRTQVTAFADWAIARSSVSTVSQYASTIQLLLRSGVDPADEEAAFRHIRDKYAVSAWGPRVAAVRMYGRFLKESVTGDAAVPEEFQRWLQETQGLKATSAYRYALCAAHLVERVTNGEPILEALDHYRQARPYASAWGRYLEWRQIVGMDVPEAWHMQAGHRFPTAILIALRTLLSHPWSFPVDRLVTMTWDESFKTPTGATTWPYVRGGPATRHLHPIPANSAGYRALMTLWEWAKPTDSTYPVVPSLPGAKTAATVAMVKAGLVELDDLTVIERAPGAPAAPPTPVATNGRPVIVPHVQPAIPERPLPPPGPLPASVLEPDRAAAGVAADVAVGGSPPPLPPDMMFPR